MSAVETVLVLVVSLLALVVLTMTQLSPLAFFFRAMSRPRAVIIGPKERTIRFEKLVKKGKVYHVPNGAVLAEGNVFHRRTRTFQMDIRYVLMKEGDPRPLEVNDDGEMPVTLGTMQLDASLFKAALNSEIALRFLHGTFDWKILVMVLLGIVAVVAVVT